MSDPTLPRVSTPTQIPGQRSSSDHPMRPDLPYADTVTYAPSAAHGGDSFFDVPTPTAPDESYAHWGRRVAALIIDYLIQIPFMIVWFIGLVVAFEGGGLTWVERAGFGTFNDTIAVSLPQMTTATWVGLAIANVANWSLLVFSIWNSIFRQGRRGATIGKQCMNLMLVSETDGRPIGALMTFIRGWAHLLDVVTLGIGYLWPLWDRKRQTFADMAMRTAVLHLPPLPPPPVVHIPAQPTRYDW